jgi:hypothetical protein
VNETRKGQLSGSIDPARPSEHIEVGCLINVTGIEKTGPGIEEVVGLHHRDPSLDKIRIGIVGVLQVTIDSQDMRERTMDRAVESDGIH